MTPAYYYKGSVPHKNIEDVSKGARHICGLPRNSQNSIDDRLRYLLKTKVDYYRKIPDLLVYNIDNTCIPVVENRRTMVRSASGEYLTSVPVASLLIEGRRSGVLKKMPISAMKEQVLSPLISLLLEERITRTRSSEQEVEQVIEHTLEAIKA